MNRFYTKTPTTVAAVMATFNKTIDQLKNVEVQNQAEAKRQADLIADADMKRRIAEAEAANANKMAEKLTALFSA